MNFANRLRLPSGPLADLARGSGWMILSSVLTQGSTLLGSLIVANIVGVRDYGHYALVQGTVNLLGMIAQLGFATIASQQISRHLAIDPAGAGRIAGFCYLFSAVTSSLFGLALFVFRVPIAEEVFRQPEIVPGLMIAAISLPWVALASLQLGTFAGLGQFRSQASLSLWIAPMTVLLPAIGAWFGGFVGAVGMLGLLYLLRSAIFQVALVRKFHSLGLRWGLLDLREWMRLLSRLALPATIAGMVVSLTIWGGQTLLVRQPEGGTLLGLFAAAYTIKTLAIFVPQQAVQALLPALSKADAMDAHDDKRSLLVNSTLASFALASLIAIGAAFLAEPIMALFGRDFRAAGPTLALLVAAAPLEAMCMTLYQDLQSREKYWQAMCGVNLPLALTVLGLAVVLIPDYAAEGLAMAWLVGWVVAFSMTLILVLRSRSASVATSA